MSSGDVVFIGGENRGRFPNAHCIYVDDELPMIIDPATRPDELERIDREAGVRFVVNTHYHIDHVRFNRLFSNAEFVAHELDAPAISSLDELSRMVGMEGTPLEENWRMVMREVWNWIETEVTRMVADGDEICLGANTVRFIHTPGHTPGHLCVEFKEKRAVYLADIDLTSFGPWYGNARSSVDDFLASVERLKKIDADTWYTAHGNGVIHGDIKDRLDEFAGVIFGRERRLLDYLSEPRTMREIIERSIIFGKPWEPREMYEFFEGTMIGKHLERLERDGLIEEKAGRWGQV